ncbi:MULTISPECIES: 3'(2'),5'-bisphosphate nucleotidase CysQ [unclassified Campylobacter]|uniref:3'(2'),5'-bisphosphate nucleotidase CysQ n=1 Tax=unclassified Campylobacter TaxID=2593542 RepID=UPI001BDA22A4|nr:MULTISPECIES: 3'(2'),5'-bisphosphate nucleotidase CysQ [unclassified Campylobacter]MBT0881434.1 3'(2'),5'-bisphosphate nucleotidase CysQ [Campylobacter sp. 2018MI27]MBT0885599.1 3'(2'),5'-bisphosphate nucleotidase CysQ [Campylobacter sp. 2018MI10]
MIAIDEIINIALNAGRYALDIFNNDFNIYYKNDKSPLTEADLVVNDYICKSLAQYSIPIISEENKNIQYSVRKNWKYCWLIDPIDGTKEFINKNKEWTINIALIHNGQPILGVVYAPALKLLYNAQQNKGAYKNNVKLPLELNKNTYKIVASKSHLNDETKYFIDNIKTNLDKEFISIGSSLKLCLVASGEADCYPRLAPTMEWDTAAAHIIVSESGKNVYNYHTLKPLKYNKENLLNPYFVAK